MELLNLPFEVLQHICNQIGTVHVEGHPAYSPFVHRRFVADYPSLANLCRACRILYEVAQPILFQETSKDVRLLPGPSFYVAVATNPRLAGYVHMAGVSNYNGLLAQDPAGMASLLSLVKKRLGVPDADTNIQLRFDQASPGLEAAMLLLFCPSLKALNVTAHQFWGEGWSFGTWGAEWAHLSAENREPLGLGSLSFRYGEAWLYDLDDEDRRGFDLSIVDEIIDRAPHLRQLRIQYLESAGGRLALENLTLLHLESCILPSSSLTKVLNAAAGLQEFRYSTLYNTISPQAIFEALASSPCCDTLVSLAIELSVELAWHSYGYSPETDQGLTEFLKGRPQSSPFPFPRLRSLLISDNCLYGRKYKHGSVVLANALPAAMQFLEVIGITDPMRPRDDLVRVAKRSAILELPEMRLIVAREIKLRKDGEEISDEWGEKFGYDALWDALDEEPGEVPGGRCHYHQQNKNSSLDI